MALKVCHRVDPDEWQEIADGCDYATFYHTPAWSKIFADIYPNIKIAPKKFLFEDGTAAIFPMIEITLSIGFMTVSNYVSNAAYVYGGWISKNEITHRQSQAIINWLNAHCKNLFWLTNPFDASLSHFAFPGSEIVKEDFTQYLNLSPGYEELWKRFSRTHRQDILQAQKKGVKCRAAQSLSDWREYYRVYQNSLQRWGNEVKFIYPFELFENMFKANSHKIKLYLATVNEKIISGALVFKHNQHVAGWHGATLKDYFSCHPWHFLINEITKDACREGYRWFDLNPSGGHKGVVKNKKGFGTIQKSTHVFLKRSARYNVFESLSGQLYKLKQHI